jgi:hypothetical protein
MKSNTAMAEPKREKVLIDKELPSVLMSRTDNAAPRRAKLLKDKELPSSR